MGTVSEMKPYSGLTTQGAAPRPVSTATCMRKESSVTSSVGRCVGVFELALPKGCQHCYVQGSGDLPESYV